MAAPAYDSGASSHSSHVLNYTVATGAATATSQPSADGELIIACVGLYSGNASAAATVTSTGSPSLSWTQYTSNQNGPDPASQYLTNSIWYAVGPSGSSATNYNITANFTGGTASTYVGLSVFCVSGQNASPFDPNGTLPGTASNSTSATNTTCDVTISTSNPDDMIVSFAIGGNYVFPSNIGSFTPATETPTTSDAFNDTAGAFALSGMPVYGRYTSTQSSVSTGFTTSASDWNLITFAITADSGGSNATADPGDAAVTVAALAPTPQVTGIPPIANVTIAALQPSISVAAFAGVANVVAAALSPAQQVLPALSTANVTVGALQPVGAVTAKPSNAPVIVSALKPASPGSAATGSFFPWF